MLPFSIGLAAQEKRGLGEAPKLLYATWTVCIRMVHISTEPPAYMCVAYRAKHELPCIPWKPAELGRGCAVVEYPPTHLCHACDAVR